MSALWRDVPIAAGAAEAGKKLEHDIPTKASTLLSGAATPCLHLAGNVGHSGVCHRSPSVPQQGLLASSPQFTMKLAHI